MGYYDGPGEGPGLLARTLDQNFGLRVDHYLAIDMQTFVRLVDTLGGLDVKVDSPINLNNPKNTPDPKLSLSEGTRHLDGETALLLATNRVPKHIYTHAIPEDHPECPARKTAQPRNHPPISSIIGALHWFSPN